MKSPLLVLASCFALGILLTPPGHWKFLSLPLLLASAGVSMYAGLTALQAGWRGVSWIFALIGFLFAGGATARLFEIRFPPNHVSHLESLGIDVSEPVVLEGWLVSSPQRTSYGSQFDVEVTSLKSRGQVHLLAGKVRLRLHDSEDPDVAASAELLHLQYGDSIRALVRLSKPRIYRNPGSFDFRLWMESIQDLYWVGTIKSPLLIEKLSRPHLPKLRGLL
jgi:predicted membrane metal-binding protein